LVGELAPDADVLKNQVPPKIKKSSGRGEIVFKSEPFPEKRRYALVIVRYTYGTLHGTLHSSKCD